MTEDSLATYRVAAIPGDGVGPEVVDAARRVLDAAGRRFGFAIDWTEIVAGGAAIDAYGVAIRPEDVETCRSSDAILLGAVGGPKWSDPSAAVRPEQALFALRGGLGLFANLRPVKVHPALVASSPLRPELLEGVDLLIVRELTGGVYFGERQEAGEEKGQRRAVDTMPYSEDEIRRIVLLAGAFALTRRRRLTSVDKANVLATSRLWRRVVDEERRRMPDVEVSHQLVDSCAMLLIKRPADFDVIVTENLFGDILSDEAAVLAGSLGHAALGVAGRPRDGAWRHLRPLRADPRVGPRHRRSGPGEPDRDDPVGRDDDVLVVLAAGCRGGDRGRSERRRSTRAGEPPTSPTRRTRTTGWSSSGPPAWRRP